LRDLGGLAMEMYRREQFREDLLSEHARDIANLEARLHELDSMLAAAAAGRRTTASRCDCGAPIIWGSHFCANCGRPAGVEAVGRPLWPRCGAPHEPNQEYCLECGLRLPVEASGLVPRLGRAWRRQLGWYPGDWVWPSLLALLIAALAGIGAAAFVSHDQKRAGYVTGTSPFEPPPPATTVPLLPATVAPTVPTQTGTQPTPPKQTPSP